MGDHVQGKWEKRWHPLREEWIVYSAHRNSRPWQGADRIKAKEAPQFDPTCYLCPGNKRISGNTNPEYKGVFVFDNDHPVVGRNAPEISPVENTGTLYKKEKAFGIARVICYDPRHNTTLSQMRLEKVIQVFESFQKETAIFQKDPAINSVFIFENKGEASGVSNPHPHCQIYATDFTFKIIEQQVRVSSNYSVMHDKNIYEEIVQQEKKDALRIIAENEHAIAFIPFFARYAYEVMVFPKQHHQTLITLSPQELTGLSKIFHEVVRKMDMNFDMDFPYVMSVMQAPVDGEDYADFRMHLWFQPPFRQPGLIKYLAGPEIGAGNFMADTMPEEKAAELQKQNTQHYTFER